MSDENRPGPDTNPPPPDTYARESFTMRRMQPWQIWTMVAVLVVVLLGVIFYW